MRRDQGMNLDRAAFFLLHTQFLSMAPENRANKTAHSLATNDAPFPENVAGYSWQDGGCATRKPHPAKGFASGLQKSVRRYASHAFKKARRQMKKWMAQASCKDYEGGSRLAGEGEDEANRQVAV